MHVGACPAFLFLADQAWQAPKSLDKKEAQALDTNFGKRPTGARDAARER